MGGREQHPAVARQEIAAGGRALARADHADVAAVQPHGILLVALPPVPRGLEDQASAVERKVGFGILAAERKLADVAQVPLGYGLRCFIATRHHLSVFEDHVAVPSVEERQARPAAVPKPRPTRSERGAYRTGRLSHPASTSGSRAPDKVPRPSARRPERSRAASRPSQKGSASPASRDGESAGIYDSQDRPRRRRQQRPVVRSSERRTGAGPASPPG